MFFEPGDDRGVQFLSENRERFRFPPFLSQIDDAHERHLVVVHAQGQIRAARYLPRVALKITFERRRGGAEQDDATLQLSAHDGDVARMITRRFLLLVGRLVFFIDDDESEVFERREDGAACADDDARPARLNLVPLVVPLAFREPAVQDRDLSSVSAKRLLKRSTVCGVSEISGTSTMAVLPAPRADLIACR